MRYVPLLLAACAGELLVVAFELTWLPAVFVVATAAALWALALRLVGQQRDASAALAWRRTAMAALDRADNDVTLRMRAVVAR